jgi:hypothetical protein
MDWLGERKQMTGRLLARGMLVGLVAALLSFCFLKLAGEPSVDRAIAFESAMDEAKAKARAEEAVAKGQPAPVEEAEPELVSRPVQAGIGLLTGVVVYSTAFSRWCSHLRTAAWPILAHVRRRRCLQR